MTLVDASHTPDQPTPSDTRVSEAGSAKIPFRDRIYLWRRTIVIAIRKAFVLEEDLFRDQLILGLRRDFNELADAYTEQLRQNTELTKLAQQTSKRLAYYEEHIPRMRELSQHYEQEQMGIRKPSNGQKILSITS